MGEVELDEYNKQLTIHSTIITYGNASDEKITEQMRDEIETMWNEPAASLFYLSSHYRVVFRIRGYCQIDIRPEEIIENFDPRNNYFRIEEYAMGNISFVDGLGCNSGYFKLENLYLGSTTAAHEYGHTLGLDHPRVIDIRGKGRPGIMYPRGTLVDPPFQYDPNAAPGQPGGTMHPMHRRVLQSDIELLNLHRLNFQNRVAQLGEFTNVYHPDHAGIYPAV
jgi:hypothetical protein